MQQKRLATTTPHKTNVIVDVPLNFLPKKYVKPTAINPQINAENWIKITPVENRIANAAPNPAPAETPNLSGETNGFLDWP